MVSREFTQDGHTTRVTITRQNSGWQFVEERDRTVNLVIDMIYGLLDPRIRVR